MKYGLLVPNWAPFDQELMLKIALLAEELGFDHLFFTDHLTNPHVESDNLPDLTVESWSLISYISALTSRIRLGTAISPIAVRPPALLAKVVATVDNLSSGRIDLGVGTGWSPGSFGLLGADFGNPQTRGKRLREGIELIQRLWSEEEVNFSGEFYLSKKGVVAPKPIQKPHPPIWDGGFREPMLKITGELADGWLPWHRPLDVYAECLKRIHDYASEAGRSEKSVLPGTVVMVVADELRDVPLNLGQGEPPNVTISTVQETVAAYAEAGAEVFIVFLYPAENVLKTIRELAKKLFNG